MSHFKLSEFTCKCGCGKNNISLLLVNMLDNARELAGIPFHITSGCRCEKHNKAVGGEPDSAHLDGLAADITANASQTRFRVVDALLQAGFNRIGIGDTFIHCDIDSSKALEVIWLYPGPGKLEGR